MSQARTVVAGLVLSAIAAAAGPASAAEPLVVGLFGPMSGERSALGTRFQEGVSTYVDEVNAAGGIAGRPLEIRVEDSRGNPREAANIAQKFAQEGDMLAVVGGWSSTESMAAAPILADAHMPQISPTASHPHFTEISDYQFRISNTQKSLAVVHADMLVKTLGMKRIAILYFQDDWGSYVNGSTAEKVAGLGGEVVLQEAMIPETRDFRALVTKVKSSGADGIFLASHYVESAVFMQQLRQAGIETPVASTDTLNDPKFVELAGAAADGVVMPTPFQPSAPAARAFSEDYEKRFGHAPDYYSAFSRDAIAVIGEAMRSILEKGGTLDRQALRDAIADGPAVAGVSGPIKFDAIGDPEVRPMGLLVVKDGAYLPYNPS